MSFLFFFQAEDGIRDPLVTGVQTCALPISPQLLGAGLRPSRVDAALYRVGDLQPHRHRQRPQIEAVATDQRALGQPRIDRRAAVPHPAAVMQPTQPRRSPGLDTTVEEPAWWP